MRIFNTLLLLSLAVGAFGQKENIKFKHLTVKDGLAHSWIRSVYKDSHGYLWFGTGNSGINKYDGASFTLYKYNPKVENGLSSNSIYTFHEDMRGRLWVGTPSGLNRYNRERDIFEQVSSSTAYNITTIEDLENGMLLLLTEGEVYLYNPDDDAYRALYNDGKIASLDLFTGGIVEYDQGKYLLTTKKGLISFDIADFSFTNVTENESDFPGAETIHFSAFYQDSKGRIWAGTESNGLFYLNYDASRRPLPVFRKNYRADSENPFGLTENGIAGILEDNNGLLWVATSNGGVNVADLTGFVGGDLHFSGYQNDALNNYSLSSNSVYALYKDSDGTVWIGTFNGGISYYNKLLFKFEHIKHNPNVTNGLNSNHINILYEEGNRLWVGTQQGLNIYDRNTNTWEHYTHDANNPRSIGANAVWAIHRDFRGQMWIGTWAGGLNLFNERTKTFERYTTDKYEISSNNIFGISEDDEGFLWLATMGGGLSRFDVEESTFKNFTANENDNTSISTNWVKSIVENQAGEIWIATGFGVDSFDKQKEVFGHLQHNENDTNSISSNQIVAIFEDSKHNMWVGTEHGLNFFDRHEGRFRVFTETDGLPNNIIRCICEDNNGNLWVSTNKGLSRFADAVNHPEEPEFVNYFLEDGLQGDEFNSRSCFKGRDGRLYFGGSNGFNIFHPDSLGGNTTAPRIVFTNLLIYNKAVEIGAHDSLLQKHISLTDGIEVSYKEAVIRIEYAALNFLSPEKNRYAYMMEGFENEWNYVGSQQFATYTNLDPGRYVFRVKAANNDGVWNEEGIALEIYVRPPFWRTPWFIATALAVIVALIVFLIKYRERELKRDKQILEAKIQAGMQAVEEQQTALEQKDRELKEREEREREQTWFNTGMNRFNQIITEQKDDTQKLAQAIVTDFVKYLEANMGALYLLNDDVDTDLHLSLTASWASDEKRRAGVRVEIDEGQVGACFRDQTIMKVDNLPQDYAVITSGLGKMSMKHMVLIPLRLNETTIGVIELLSLHELPNYRVRFVEKAGETLTSIIQSIKSGEKTRKILEEQKAQAEELSAQEEELRQNLEEMQATHEAASRNAKELEKLSAEKEEKELYYQQKIAELEETIARLNGSK